MTEQWRGIHKLTEESGELLQVLGKLGPFPSGNHPDGGSDLSNRVTLEISDVYAALDYFVEANKLSKETITICRHEKLQKFRHWGLTGLKS